ncbi:MAG: hypothetical protein AAF840_15015, partial [Bacteroidota bacterium]
PTVPPISWQEFKSSFLPPVRNTEPAFVAAALQPSVSSSQQQIETDSYCLSRVTPAALIKAFRPEDDNPEQLDWILHPEHLEIIVSTRIPAKTASLVSGNGDGQQPADKTTDLVAGLATPPAAIDIGPCDIATEHVLSDIRITLYRREAGQPSRAFDFSAHSTVTPIFSASPQSLWNREIALQPNLQKVNSTPLNIANTLTGFTIKGKLRAPEVTLPIDVAHLQYEYADHHPTFFWSGSDIRTINPDPDADGTAELMQTINSVAVTTKRNSILAALKQVGVAVREQVHVDHLAQEAADVLLDAPALMQWVDD